VHLIELASLLLACALLGGLTGWSIGTINKAARIADQLEPAPLDMPASPGELIRHKRRRLVTTAWYALGGVLVGVLELAFVLR
jgi:hypothetical protein